MSFFDPVKKSNMTRLYMKCMILCLYSENIFFIEMLKAVSRKKSDLVMHLHIINVL